MIQGLEHVCGQSKTVKVAGNWGPKVDTCPITGIPVKSPSDITSKLKGAKARAE